MAALFVVAGATMPRGFALFERRASGRFVVPVLPRGLGLVFAFLVIAAAVAAVITSFSMVGRVRKPSTLRAAAPLLIALVFGVIFVVVALVRDPAERPAPTPTATMPSPPPAEPADPVEASRALGAVLTVIILGGLVVGLVVGGRHLIRRRERPFGPGETLERELATALADVRTVADPRRAVIACYARMERALAMAGVPRGPTETSLELLQRVLVELEVAGPSARRLTGLFERAKFSHHDIGEPMRSEAIDALEDVRAQLRSQLAVALTEAADGEPASAR